MRVYRCYFLNERGRTEADENIEAHAPDEAVDRALALLRQQSNHKAVETEPAISRQEKATWAVQDLYSSLNTRARSTHQNQPDEVIRLSGPFHHRPINQEQVAMMLRIEGRALTAHEHSMKLAEEFRRNADEWRQLERLAATDEYRRRIAQIANTWLAWAEQRERRLRARTAKPRTQQVGTTTLVLQRKNKRR
jgi:hypothetical protein